MITVKRTNRDFVIGISRATFKDMKAGDVIEIVHEDGTSIRLVAVSDVGAPCGQCYFRGSNDGCPRTWAFTLMCSMFPQSYSLVKSRRPHITGALNGVSRFFFLLWTTWDV